MKKEKSAPVLSPTSHPLCLDPKPFILTLFLLTLTLTLTQLHPYQSLLSLSFSPPPCTTTTPSNPNPTVAAAVIQQSTAKLDIYNSKHNNNNNNSNSNNIIVIKNKNKDKKRLFTPIGSAASLFVLFGAYRGGPTSFSVIGLASKPLHVFSRPWFKCEYHPNSPNSLPIRSKAIKYLPDWGYGRIYTVVVINCTFPSNPNPDPATTAGKLFLYTYPSPNPRKFQKLLVLEEKEKTSSSSSSSSSYYGHKQYDYLYCGSSLYGNLSASRIREWMAYHAHFFGPSSHFVFHDAGGVGAEVRRVLEPWVEAGRVMVEDVREQEMYDGYYYNQFLVVNDCLHRYRNSANWTFFFDVDEYLYLPGGRSLEEVVGQLGRFTQFTIEQNPMSSKLCVKDPHTNYSR